MYQFFKQLWLVLRGFKLMEFYVATAVFQVANMYRPKNHRLDTLPILAHLSLALFP